MGMSLLVALLVLVTCSTRAAAQPLTRGCGGWLMSSGGWRCYRLAHNYELYYRVANDTLHLGLDVWPTNTTGLTQLDWIGIGISEAGGMPGADIAVLTRNTSSPRGWDLWDMFAPSFARPEMDDQQDKTLLLVQERANGRVRARLSFPLTSCDQRQDRPVRPGLQSYVIYAFGQGEFEYHGAGNRGDAVLLLAPGPNNATHPPNATAGNATNTTLRTAPPTRPSRSPTRRPQPVRTLNMTMPAIPLPTNDTDPYICLDFELPGTLDQPFHLIEFETVENTTGPVTQPRYVHHLVLYNCTARPPTLGRGPYECSNTPELCSAFTLVSTHGRTTLPEAAGFRMGVGAMRYVTMQVHYNNVDLDEGLIDSSGFKITYTPRLRPNDMGTLTTGVTGFMVPPRSRWSPGPNICPASCTRRFEQPVTLVSTLLHMHQIGAAMSLQHYTQVNNTNSTDRNSTSHWVELEPPGNRTYYDFDFQPYTPIPLETSTLLPGDVLVTTCTYNNRQNRTVPMGLRSSEEMCFAYTMYYPVSDINWCTDFPGSDTSGLAMCRGYSDGDVIDLLAATGSMTPQQQQQVVLLALERGVLVPRNPETVANATPFVAPLPSTCTAA